MAVCYLNIFHWPGLTGEGQVNTDLGLKMMGIFKYEE